MALFTSPVIAYRKPHVLGFILYFIVGLVDGAIVPFFPLWAQQSAAIPVEFIGLLFGCYAGGELLAAPFIGGIADRVGRRPVLIISATGVGAGFIALFFAHGVFAAAAVLIVIGLFESVLHPTIYTIVADATPAAEHRRQFSMMRVCSGAGAIAGPLLGTVLVQEGLGYVFLAGGSVMVAGGLMLAICLSETRSLAADAEDEGDEEGFSALLPAFRDSRLAVLLMWVLLLGVAGSWVEAVMPLHASNQMGMSAASIGYLFAFGAGVNTVGQLALTKLFARRSPLFITLSAGSSLITAFVLLLAYPHVVTLVMAVCLYSLSQMMTGPLIPTAVNKLAPARLRATYMAALSVVSDLQGSVGPATGTALFALSFTLPWAVGIPLVLLAVTGLGLALSAGDKSATR
ncbi:transporter, major facilitator family protein [Cedecea neteri]|uniref:Transporter, major facilitator family protein n=1 Tax=Cedecea neteri TaxID=158822 RepID=A0A089Q7R2_9ENTR|nr:MFS transporter [Cedecea neteri]AIR06504.1 transporter, major facilitator family protein [Cedecea neteri]